MQTLFPNDAPEFQMDLNDPFNTDPQNQPWAKICRMLKGLLSAQEFTEWVAPLRVISESSTEIVVGIPDLVFYQSIIDSFLDKIEFCKTSLGINVLIRFEVLASTPDQTAKPGASANQKDFGLSPEFNQIEFSGSPVADGARQEFEPSPNMNSSFTRALTHHSTLNPEYCFESFVRGPSNQFAHASCLAVADNPGKAYNPLFIYGSTGLGKTHLLHAVGNKVLQTKKNAVITYISSERFMNEMIYCLRFDKMWDFRKKYRNCDVLLVDDIQFISGKERTQEEFFHTFNALYEAKGQIVVTSDIFPQDIPDIEDRLRNRFQWGLIADIQPPDVEHRVAILMNKADKQGIHLNNDVAMYIATHAKGNVRVLEGALRRISAFAKLQGRPLNLELASEILQNVLGEPPKRLTIEVIQQVVADHFKLKVADLKSKKRQRAFAIPRQIAMYLARTRTNSSFPEIGTRFGGKDHTTVMHAVKKIKDDATKDIDLKTHIESLDRRLDQQC